MGKLPTTTYVVARPQRRFEIRESALTELGPRARTLATFRELDDAVLARARARALKAFDAQAVRAAARRVGAPVAAADPVEQRARALLADLDAGHTIPPVLAALLRERLVSSAVVDDNIEAVVPWIGATTAQRGAALHDLLGVADRIPTRERPPLAFPRLSGVSDA